MTEITLVHVGGERKTVPVIVVTEKFVTITWGMSGAYSLDLRKNVLTAHSASAKRKGPALWSSPDIVELRKQVEIHLRGITRKEETEIAAARHRNSMPHSGK